MSLSARQFQQLTTMGIDLWQARDGVYKAEQVAKPAPKAETQLVGHPESPLPASTLQNIAPQQAKTTLQEQSQGQSGEKILKKDEPMLAKKPLAQLKSKTRTTLSKSELKAFVQSSLFADIAQSLNSTIDDVVLNSDSVGINELTWLFNKDKAQNTFTFANKQLQSPHWQNIASDPKLKQQLWQLLCQSLTTDTK